MKSQNTIRFIKGAMLGAFCLSVGIICGQNQGSDIITLKDGNVHRGEVIEQKPGRYIKLLQIPSHDTLLIELKTIDLLSKTAIEKGAFDEEHKEESKLDLAKLKLFNVNDYHAYIKASTGAGDFAFSGFGLEVTKTMTPKLQIGMGVSYHGKTGQMTNFEQSMPFTAELKYELQEHSTGRTAIMANLSAGYNLILNGDYLDSYEEQNAYLSNGLYFSPSIGFRLNLSQEMGIMINAGYQFISSNGYEKDTDLLLREQNWSNFIASGSFFF